MKTINTPHTRQLQDEMNKPLHVQKESIETNKEKEDSNPVLTFDDTDEKLYVSTLIFFFAISSSTILIIVGFPL